MSVKVVSADTLDIGSVIEDSKIGEPIELNDNYDCVDGEKVKFEFAESGVSFKMKTSSQNCHVENIYATEINDNSHIDTISLNQVLRSDGSLDEDIIKIPKNQDIPDDTRLDGDCERICDDTKIISKKLNMFIKKKRKKILTALAGGDIDYLKEAAVSRGGLLSDDIRRKVWPKLVGVDVFETSPRPGDEEIENHPYYRQVVLDVNRSLKRFPPSIKEAQRLAMLDQLVLLIMRVLCRHPEMHYYQGYHDICVTFLLVLGEETAYYVVEKLSRTHLKIFMEQSMEPTIELLSYMYPLISKKNPQLASFLLKSEVGVAYCLSWLITWFGHVLNDYDDVVRLFDFFIVSHSWMPMYLTTVVVLHREEEVLQQDCDMACVHSLLSRVPDDLPFEDLIPQSIELYKFYNPKTLSRERPLSENKLRTRLGCGLMRSLAKTIKSSVPASNFTVPLVIAAAVLVTAVLYQAYKY